MRFDSLVEMVKTINQNKIKNIKVLGSDKGKKKSLVDSLYYGIAQGEITSDEEASSYIYGSSPTSTDSAIYVKYQRLKNRLIRQLKSTALFVDVNQPQFREHQQAFYNCNRDFAVALMLLERNAQKPAVELLEQILEPCLSYEFIGLSTEVIRFLRTFYGLTIGDRKKAESYARLHQIYEEKRRLEAIAFDCYENLFRYLTSSVQSRYVSGMASEYYDKLKGLVHQCDTTMFYYYYYQIGIIKCQSNNDCLGTIELVDEALPLLESRKNLNQNALTALAMQKFVCLIKLRIFENGDTTAEYCLNASEPGTFNWFRTLETYFFYCMHTKRYQKALDIFTKAQKNPKFSSLDSRFYEVWKIFEAYLHLLSVFGKINLEEVDKSIGAFRLARFLNDTPVFSKDKTGMNIPIIVIQVLLYIAYGQYASAIDRIEAFDKYRQRYLTTDENIRSNIFAKIIVAYINTPHTNATFRKIRKDLDKLKNLQPQVNEQIFLTEIIPYEDLTEMLLKKHNLIK